MDDIRFIMLLFCNLTIFLPCLRKQNYKAVETCTIGLEKEELSLDKRGISIDERF